MVPRGPLADLTALTAPEVYHKFVSIGTLGWKLLYVKLQKALYGLLKSELLFYRKLWGGLYANGFENNPYNSWVANKTINGEKMTVAWHVDDLKMSQKSLSVNTGIIGWPRGIYGELRISRGKKHEYLGMDLNYSVPGNAIFSVEKHTRNAITEFPRDLGKTAETPMAKYIFIVQDNDSR